MPRISALFDDLNPSQGGTVSWKQLADRAAVTWEDVPEYNAGNANTFQVEMFFDGRVRVSYRAIAAADGIAGLSEGNGVDPEFFESDLSSMGDCVPPGDCDDDGDVDEDDYAVFTDCFSGPGGGLGPGCECVALDADGDVDCKDWNLFRMLWSGSGDPPTFGPCTAPSVTAVGGRYLAITPPEGSDPVALLLTGNAGDPGVSCVSLYVQADGSLDTAPVFQSPTGPGGWDTIYAYGVQVMPDTVYNVQGDYGSPGSPLLSPTASAVTWLWGEVERNDVVNFTDIQWTVLGFEGTAFLAAFEAMNIAPCDIDDALNFTDIQAAILSFEGAEYRGPICSLPCP